MLKPWLDLWAVNRVSRLLEQNLPGLVSEWVEREHPEFPRLFAYWLYKALAQASPAWARQNQFWMRKAYIKIQEEPE